MSTSQRQRSTWRFQFLYDVLTCGQMRINSKFTEFGFRVRNKIAEQIVSSKILRVFPFSTKYETQWAGTKVKMISFRVMINIDYRVEPPQLILHTCNEHRSKCNLAFEGRVRIFSSQNFDISN